MGQGMRAQAHLPVYTAAELSNVLGCLAELLWTTHLSIGTGLLKTIILPLTRKFVCVFAPHSF